MILQFTFPQSFYSQTFYIHNIFNYVNNENFYCAIDISNNLSPKTLNSSEASQCCKRLLLIFSSP